MAAGRDGPGRRQERGSGGHTGSARSDRWRPHRLALDRTRERRLILQGSANDARPQDSAHRQAVLGRGRHVSGLCEGAGVAWEQRGVCHPVPSDRALYVSHHSPAAGRGPDPEKLPYETVTGLVQRAVMPTAWPNRDPPVATTPPGSPTLTRKVGATAVENGGASRGPNPKRGERSCSRTAGGRSSHWP